MITKKSRMLINIKNQMKKNKGFTTIECLMALIIYGLCTILLVSSLMPLKSMRKPHFNEEDKIGINQIRLIIACSKDIKVKDDSISLNYQNEPSTLIYKNQKLIQEPGFQVFINNLKSLKFKVVDNVVYMIYIHNGEDNEIKKAICVK